MTSSLKLQLLTCLVVYVSNAHAIMVKFGTKNGPIEPPKPTPSLPPPLPYRVPAPVWEPRDYDAPDPNANWRPTPYVPRPLYTQTIYNPQAPNQIALNNAQKFAFSYLPQNNAVSYTGVPAPPVTNYFTPAQIVSQLSSQSVPGIGIRYFVPVRGNNDYVKENKARQEDAKYNDIESNIVDDNDRTEGKRKARESQEASQTVFVYQWPEYISRRH